MILKVINKSNNPMPAYQTEGAAGLDLHAYINEPITLKPLERRLVETGLYLEIPVGYEGQIRARSGLSVKHGITLINAVGTIDSDYRGEIKVGLVNLSNEEYTISNGDRIAQLVLSPIVQAEIIEVQTLDETERASGGFGSTGFTK
ncbi:dUTP diphosphatase [Guggenheimella bovis]